MGLRLFQILHFFYSTGPRMGRPLGRGHRREDGVEPSHPQARPTQGGGEEGGRGEEGQQGGREERGGEGEGELDRIEDIDFLINLINLIST